MKKQLLSAAAIASVAAIAFTPSMAQATSFDCSKAAIWAYDGDSKHLAKINPFGHLVSTVTLQVPDNGEGSGSGDVAIDATYHHVFLVNFLDGIESYNPTTGAMDSGYPKAITGVLTSDMSNSEDWSVAAGVIDGGNILTNAASSTEIYSINPNTGVSTEWADITNAESGLPAGGLTGGTWQLGADFVQAADGNVYSLATNSNYSNNLLVRINPNNTTQMTVVAQLPDEASYPVGMARAGDNLYVTDSEGVHVFQLGTISSTASDEKTTAVDAGTWDGLDIWGLAGTNDSSPGSTNCTFDVATGKTNGLANTGGAFSDYYGLAATGAGLVAAGAYLAIARRKEEQN